MSIVISPNIIETEIDKIETTEDIVNVTLSPFEYTGTINIKKVILEKLSKLIGRNFIFGRLCAIIEILAVSKGRILNNDHQCKINYHAKIACKKINIKMGDIIPNCFLEACKEDLAIFNKGIIEIIVENKHINNSDKAGSYHHIQCLSNISSLGMQKMIIYGKIIKSYDISKYFTWTRFWANAGPNDTAPQNEALISMAAPLAETFAINELITGVPSRVAIINDANFEIAEGLLKEFTFPIVEYLAKNASAPKGVTIAKLHENVAETFDIVICVGLAHGEIAAHLLTIHGLLIIIDELRDCGAITTFMKNFSSVSIYLQGIYIFHDLISKEIKTSPRNNEAAIIARVNTLIKNVTKMQQIHDKLLTLSK